MLRFLCLVYSNDIVKNITIVKSYARKLVDTTDSTGYQQKMNKSLMESLEIHKEYAGDTHTHTAEHNVYFKMTLVKNRW